VDNINLIVDRNSMSEFSEVPYSERQLPETTYEIFQQAANKYADKIALTFIEHGDVNSPPIDISYASLLGKINQAGNLFRSLGVGVNDVVSILLPNLLETHYALWGGQAVGVISPINPFLEAHAICDILNATKSKVLVTLAETDGRDSWEKALAIVDQVPSLQYVLTVSLPDSSKSSVLESSCSSVNILDFGEEMARHDVSEIIEDMVPVNANISAYFHTGGTTGSPKVACHSHANQVFMAFMFNNMFKINGQDKAMGGLPLFHVNAIYTSGLALFLEGANVLVLGADGFRNKSCVQDFWRVVAKYKATLFSGVPTFYSALLEIPVGDNNIGSLRVGLMGAAPASPELFKQIEEAMGLNIIEGYGLTEGTCLSSVNPYDGDKKVGSIGLSIPYQTLKTVEIDSENNITRDCEPNESGVIVIKGPNVFQGYLNKAANAGVLLADGWLNTGDLGRIDDNGYIWLTGRAKDLIIRGGHNIDPKMIEDTLSKYPTVALVAAIGQPDSYAGELPVVYVTLKPEKFTSEKELISFAKENISERAAVPIYLEILDQMPVTALGKIFKPKLRCMAIERVLKQAFAEQQLVVEFDIINDKKLGIVIDIKSGDKENEIIQIINGFGLNIFNN
jgi:fatty-acyl-CoA synthase